MSRARRSREVDPRAYAALGLRAHELLDDVPLHDAWRMRLRGAPEDTRVADVFADFVTLEGGAAGPVVRALFALRAALGSALGWDRVDETARGRSYAARLTEEDRARSSALPALDDPAVTVLYAFEREALAEVINRTVHAFLCFSLVPDDEGVTVYFGVYVKPVSRLTPLYMALIDPFRRWIVYPGLIRRFEARWACGARGPDRRGPQDGE